MVATLYNETIKSQRQSAYIMLSKARVWVSEGWSVTITDPDGKRYAVAEFETFVAGLHPLRVSAQETAIAPEAPLTPEAVEGAVAAESAPDADNLVAI
jgi:hypothetical protein